MTKGKNTKRALLASMLSLILCAAMLIGSTFAWFTDTVTSGKNRIVAGNLNVELLWSEDGADYTIVNADTNMFGDALWEPGYTRVVYLKVENAGSLALKYRLGINVDNETPGTNVYGDKFNLSDFIKFGVVHNQTTAFIEDAAGRAAALAAVAGSVAPISAGYASAPASLVAGDMSKPIALVVYMPEDVDNIANYKTSDENPTEYQPSIDLGVILNATQDAVESDGFGSDYDEEAWSMMDPAAHLEALLKQGYIPAKTAAALKSALEGTAAPNGKVVMSGDVTVEDGTQISVLKDTVIDFNGNTLTGTLGSGSITEGEPNVNLMLSDPMNDGSKYTIDGAAVPVGGDYTQIAGITVWQPTVTFESGRYTHDNAVVHCQLETDDPNAVGVVINGGTFDGKGAAHVIYNAAGTVIINGGTFNANKNTTTNKGGACFVLSTDKKSVPTITTVNGGTFTADACMFLIAAQSDCTQKLEVKGGTFILDEPNTKLVLAVGGSAKGILEITGGTFNVDPSEYVDINNYKVTEVNGMYTVTAR